MDDAHLRALIEAALIALDSAARLLHYASFATSLSDPLPPLYDPLDSNAGCPCASGPLRPTSSITHPQTFQCPCLGTRCQSPPLSATIPIRRGLGPARVRDSKTSVLVSFQSACRGYRRWQATAPACVRAPPARSLSARNPTYAELNLAIFSAVRVRCPVLRGRCCPTRSCSCTPSPGPSSTCVWCGCAGERMKTAIASRPRGPFIVQKGSICRLPHHLPTDDSVRSFVPQDSLSLAASLRPSSVPCLLSAYLSLNIGAARARA